MRKRNITGLRSGKLTVIKLDHIEIKNNKKQEYYLCQCDCGKKVVVGRYYLMSNRIKSCGCSRFKENKIVINDNFAIIYIKTTLEDKEIKVLIDKEDVFKINFVKWFAEYDNKLKGYYIRAYERGKSKNRKNLFLHRYIMDCPDDMVIDHINHDTLDNRKENLRIVSHTENMQNLSLYSTNKSGYKNIYFAKDKKLWICKIQKNKKIVFYKQDKDLNKLVILRNNFLKESEV